MIFVFMTMTDFVTIAKTVFNIFLEAKTMKQKQLRFLYKKQNRNNKRYYINNCLFNILFNEKGTIFNIKKNCICKHGKFKNCNNKSHDNKIKTINFVIGYGCHNKPFEYSMKKCRRY